MSVTIRNIKGTSRGQRTRKPFTVLVIILFAAAGLVPFLAQASTGADPGTTTISSSTSGRSELIVQEGKLHNISGAESFDTVIIKDSATLNIKKGATLTTKEVKSEGGSIIVDGLVKVQNGDIGGECMFHGRGPYLKVNNDGKIQVIGPASGDTVELSQGGRAAVDFMADDYIEVKGEISVAGSTGADATAPWGANGLTGYSSAGGSGDILLRTKSRPSSYITLNTAKLTASGGTAGKAADGEGSASGGYSDGGIVDGFVGSGGQANITISGYSVEVTDSTIIGTGGRGGDGGNGADGSGTTGGGGGGYAGGAAISGGTGNGVAVAGNVGAGGYVNIDIFATTEAYIFDTSLSGTGGIGGDAGNGGRGGAGTTGGGGGGGGYGGGGGAAGGGATVNGEGTAVIGHVGAGGQVTFKFDAGDTVAIAGDSTLTLTGGRGGSFGTGGTAPGGAGGGGGYGGGGGSSGWSAIGGSTMVGGQVGDGGDVSIEFNEYTISVGKAVEIFATGGQPGIGDADPGDTGTRSNTGGQGAGKSTTSGWVHYQIPKTAPYLKYPKEGQIVSSMPTFRWDLVHESGPSPTIGVDNYVLEVSDNITFDLNDLVINEDGGPTFDDFTPESMPGGKYWWRVKAKFGSETVTSSKHSFYYNKPPSLKKGMPPIRVNEDQNLTHALNLDEYFTDDLYPDSMVYGIVEDINVIHDVILSLEGERNQWLNLNVTEDFFGQEYFNISATDEGGLTGYSGILSVIILPVNDAPTIGNLEDQLVTEDEVNILPLSEILYDEESWNPLTPKGDSVYQIGYMDVTTDSDYITVIKNPEEYPPTIDLHMLYTEEVGTEYVNITVSDGKDETTIEMIVNVSAVNDPPVLSEIPDISLQEDTPKTIDLKKYVYDEEDPIENLTWTIRFQDRMLLDFELEEGGLLRLIPKAELSGQTKLYLTVKDSDKDYDSTVATVEVKKVDDPPRLMVDHLYVPKGTDMVLDMRAIMEDVDSPIDDLQILDVMMLNETGAINMTGLTTVRFSYPDNNRVNDTMMIRSSDGGVESTENLTILLGYAPEMKRIKEITFYEDEKYALDLGRYVSDKDDDIGNLTWETAGFDPSFIDPEISKDTGKLEVKAYKSGSGNFTVTVIDESGFQVSTVVKVSVEPVTGVTYLKRHPGLMGGIVGFIALIVIVVVLVVMSKRFGFPFKGMKEGAEEEAVKTEGPVTEGPPPPPEGWVEGQGWEQPPPDGGAGPAPEGGPEPPGPEKPVEPPTEGKPVEPPAGPKLVPPPTIAKPDGPAPVAHEGVKCPRCKEELPPGAKHCPVCGVPTDKESRKRLRELRRKDRKGELNEEEEAELARLEEGVGQSEGAKDKAPPATDGPKCPKCGEEIEPEFIKCPACNEQLKEG